MMETERKPTIKEWLKDHNMTIGDLAWYLHRDRGYVCGVLNGTQALGIDVFNDLPKEIKQECSFIETRYSNELSSMMMIKRLSQIRMILESRNGVLDDQDLSKVFAIMDGYYDGWFGLGDNDEEL